MSEGNPDHAELPAEERARLGELLLGAAYGRNIGLVRKLAQQGAPVDAKDAETGLTALHIAIGTNNLALVKYLIEECGTPFTADGRGRMPSALAAECRASDELSDYVCDKEAAAEAEHPGQSKN